MIIRSFILIFISILFISCGRGDKQQEYIEEKVPSPETKKEEVKKPDTTASITKTENTESKKETTKKFDETPPAVISPLEATDYMGKSVTVKGLVVDVYKSDKVAYLNFVKKYPDNPFTGVIFANKFEEFGDIMKYENKNIEITGRVSTFRGKPQMILDSKSQIKISE